MVLKWKEFNESIEKSLNDKYVEINKLIKAKPLKDIKKEIESVHHKLDKMTKKNKQRSNAQIVELYAQKANALCEELDFLGRDRL